MRRGRPLGGRRLGDICPGKMGVSHKHVLRAGMTLLFPCEMSFRVMIAKSGMKLLLRRNYMCVAFPRTKSTQISLETTRSEFVP